MKQQLCMDSIRTGYNICMMEYNTCTATSDACCNTDVWSLVMSSTAAPWIPDGPWCVVRELVRELCARERDLALDEPMMYQCAHCSFHSKYFRIIHSFFLLMICIHTHCKFTFSNKTFFYQICWTVILQNTHTHIYKHWITAGVCCERCVVIVIQSYRFCWNNVKLNIKFKKIKVFFSFIEVVNDAKVSGLVFPTAGLALEVLWKQIQQVTSSVSLYMCATVVFYF